MTKVLLDGCVPQWLRHKLGILDVETARFAGLDQLPDGELLNAMVGRFDILVTLDRNLSYQNQIAGRPIGIVVLRVADQSPPSFSVLVPSLTTAINEAKPGTLTIVLV